MLLEADIDIDMAMIMVRCIYTIWINSFPQTGEMTKIVCFRSVYKCVLGDMYYIYCLCCKRGCAVLLAMPFQVCMDIVCWRQCIDEFRLWLSSLA